MSIKLIARSAMILALAAGRLSAQDRECSYGKIPGKGDELPSYTLRDLSPGAVNSLRNSLGHDQWAEAIRYLVNNYQPGLPAWIIYIDTAGAVRQCVIADERAGKIVRGKRLIWAMVFSDLPLGPDLSKKKAAYDVAVAKADSADSVARTATRKALDESRAEQAAFRDLARAHLKADPQNGGKQDTSARAATQLGDATGKWASADSALRAVLSPVPPKPAYGKGDDTLDLLFYRRTLMRQPDPVIVGLIKGFAKGFGLDAPSAPAGPADSVRVVDIRQISSDSTANPMWIAIGRIGLAENGVFELSIGPYPGRSLPGFANKRAPLQLDRIYTNLADVREHTWELGLLTGVVFGRRIPTYDANLQVTGHSSPADFNTYVSIFANLPAFDAWFQVPWKQSWQRSSVGLFAGTNINGNMGDQFVTGVSVGHFIGDAGISIGTAWVPTTVVRNGSLGSSKLSRLFVGADLRL